MKKSPKSHSLTCASTGRAAGSICLLTCHCQIGYFTLVISMWMRNTWPNNGKNWDFTIKTFSDFAARWDPSLKGCGRLFSTMVSNSLKLSVVVSLLKPYKIVKVKAKLTLGSHLTLPLRRSWWRRSPHRRQTKRALLTLTGSLSSTRTFSNSSSGKSWRQAIAKQFDKALLESPA